MPPSIWPEDDGPSEELLGVTLRFTPRDHARLRFLADLWNAGDLARGAKRRRKWKLSSVAMRLLAAQFDLFADQIGGWPADEREARDLIAKAVAGIKARNSRK